MYIYLPPSPSLCPLLLLRLTPTFLSSIHSAENTDLAYPATLSGYPSARMCYSNHGIVGGTQLDSFTLPTGGSDFCGVDCANAPGCEGFTFTPFNTEGTGECVLYGPLGDAGSAIVPGTNIYALAGTVCPPVVVV